MVIARYLHPRDRNTGLKLFIFTTDGLHFDISSLILQESQRVGAESISQPLKAAFPLDLSSIRQSACFAAGQRQKLRAPPPAIAPKLSKIDPSGLAEEALLNAFILLAQRLALLPKIKTSCQNTGQQQRKDDYALSQATGLAGYLFIRHHDILRPV